MRQLSRRKLVIVGGVLGAALFLSLIGIFFQVGQPDNDNQAEHNIGTVVLNSLFKHALAQELPNSGNTTLWQITGSQQNGSQYVACTNDTQPPYDASHDLFFNDGTQSAWYSLGGYPNAQAFMRYSADPKLPAYDDDVFRGLQGNDVKQILNGAQITDKLGNPLPADSTTAKQTTGDYEVYAKLVTPKTNYKDYVEGCSKLMVDVVIDASTGLYRTISIYNGSIDEAQLSFRLKQEIKTSAVSWDEALPILNQNGFDLAAAKSSYDSSAYDRLINTDAGFEMSYLKPLAGEYQLKINKANESITSYTYHFAKQPELQTTVRTRASTEWPRTPEELREGALKRGWTIGNVVTGDDSHVPGCKAGDSEQLVVADDGYMQYVLSMFTCGSFPSVYTTYPKHLDQHIKTIYSEYDNTPVAGFGRFAPGGVPQLMH